MLRAGKRTKPATKFGKSAVCNVTLAKTARGICSETGDTKTCNASLCIILCVCTFVSAAVAIELGLPTIEILLGYVLVLWVSIPGLTMIFIKRMCVYLRTTAYLGSSTVNFTRCV